MFYVNSIKVEQDNKMNHFKTISRIDYIGSIYIRIKFLVWKDVQD